MPQNKRLINVVAQLGNQVVAAIVSLIVTSFVVEQIGEDVYGFVGLANSFVSYASIATIALNSMASRFIAMEQYRNNELKAKEYYVTTFFANLFIAIACSILGVLVVTQMDVLLNVPQQHLTEIQVLWILIFGSFAIELLTTVFRTSTFVTNRLYLSSLATMFAVIVRAMLVILLLYLSGCKIWFIGLGTMVSTVIQFALHLMFSHKLTPQYQIRWKNFRYKSLIEIISSGVWNTVTQLGKLLSEGLDLVIANIVIDAQAMGVLSISKVLSTYVQTFTGSVASTMLPQLTMLYSKKDKANYVRQLYCDMDLLSVMSCFSLTMLYTLAEAFYSLWVPSQDAGHLTLLTFLGSFWMVVSGVIGSVFNSFTVQNRLKYNSMLMLISGVLNTVLLLIVLKTTRLGIYAVAGISSLVYIVKNLFFIIPYAQKHVGISKGKVYQKILLNVIVVVALVVLQRFALSFLDIANWFQFMVAGGCVVLLTVTVLFFALISKEQRTVILKNCKGMISGE